MNLIDNHNIDYNKIPKYANSMPNFFAYNKDISKNAYINWRTDKFNDKHNLIVLGKAYFESAYRLLQECIKKNLSKDADSLIFPILFNTIHGVELYLKGLFFSFNILMGKKNSDYKDSHNLQYLVKSTELLIKEFEKNEFNLARQFIDCISVVKNFIQLIYVKTNDMTFARYPTAAKKNNKREKHFYINDMENVVIDLIIFIEEIAMVYKCLDFIYDSSNDYIHFLNEMQKEYQDA